MCICVQLAAVNYDSASLPPNKITKVMCSFATHLCALLCLVPQGTRSAEKGVGMPQYALQ